MAYRKSYSKKTYGKKSYSKRKTSAKKSTRRAAPRAQVIKIQFSHVPMQQPTIPLVGQDGQLVSLAKPKGKESKL